MGGNFRQAEKSEIYTVIFYVKQQRTEE